MNFNEKISALGQRASSMMHNLVTEEATKNALIMPFIGALGYDVFNPLEVIPEFTADVGTKKGEKVDYAISQNDEIIMLFECKKAGVNLGTADMSQLYRYFAVTKARIAILTNGVQYRFFSDLEEPNKMDQRPFMELNLIELKDEHVTEVEKLGKGSFDIEKMLDAATELKYTREIRQILDRQFDEPEDDFVRFFYVKAVPGARFTAAAREQFSDFVRKALPQYINERINRRLQSALQQERTQPEVIPPAAVEQEPVEDMSNKDSSIITTEEELEGYYIVKSIVRSVVNAQRVVHRDTKSYMGILLDNNNRKPICRLRFNSSTKYLGIIGEDKQETTHVLEELDDIYKYAEELKLSAQKYAA